MKKGRLKLAVVAMLLAPTVLGVQTVFAEEDITPASEEVAPVAEEVVEEEVVEETSGEVEEALEESLAEVAETPVVQEETITEDSDTVDSQEVPEVETEADNAEKETKATVTMTVDFLLEDGTLIGSDTLTGEEGEVVGFNLEMSVLVIDFDITSGFEVVYDPDSDAAYFIGALDANVPYLSVTVRLVDLAGEVAVNFVDDAGNPVIGAAIVTLGGEVGDVVTYTPAEIAGYTYNGGDVTVTLTEEEQEVTVVYERVTTNLTVICQDEAGNKLMEDQVFEGKFAEMYTLTPARISGYTLQSANGAAVDGPINIEFTESDQTMVLVYSKHVTPVVPAEPEITPTTPEPQIETMNAPKAAVEEKELPETGEGQANGMLTVIGTMMVVSMAYIVKKKHDHQLDA